MLSLADISEKKKMHAVRQSSEPPAKRTHEAFASTLSLGSELGWLETTLLLVGASGDELQGAKASHVHDAFDNPPVPSQAEGCCLPRMCKRSVPVSRGRFSSNSGSLALA